MRMSGHVFCAALCHEHHLREESKSHWARRRAALANHPAARWAVMGLALGMLAFLTWISLSLARAGSFDAAEPPAATGPAGPSAPLQTGDADWNLPGVVHLSEPADRSEVPGNRIAVRGEAPPGAIVGLVVNGELLDAVLAADGMFRFEEVALSQDVNTVQARYYDRHGTSAYSNAAVVFLRGARRAPRPAAMEVAAVPESIAEGADNVLRGPLNRRRVYLTLDGGSSDNVTEDVLRILAQHQVKATVFLTGAYIERYPRHVVRMALDGHEIANHTYSHPHLTTFAANRRHQTLRGVSREFLQDEMRRTAELYRQASGHEMSRVWRAPYGEHNRQIRAWIEEMGYTHVGWTPGMDSLDWVADRSSPLYSPMKGILRRMLDFDARKPHGASGAILLFHLGSERPPEERVPVILHELIEGYRAQGMEFGVLSELLPSSSPAAKPEA
jgi:peptidoglycan/xylan/chitin deacetylase (PgdA/CDA1 family)